jgi:SAM-dependent methyltransferase
MPDLSTLDWDALDRLRALFLSGQAGADGAYWHDAATLATYDATYAERIGWKWDALLRELNLRRWSPPPGTLLLDFGCGSGVASRRVLGAFGAEHFTGLALYDHSAEALAYASARARADYPSLALLAEAGEPDPAVSFTLVISHVLNELTLPAREVLCTLAVRATAVLWIEPGTAVDSRALATVRDRLRSAHRIIAPCTHRENCPLFLTANARDWCHFFAAPPTGVQNAPDWVRFSQRAGLDLRSQAYACLVLENQKAAMAVSPAPTDCVNWPLGAARLLGRPEVFKPYARFLACDAAGLHWLELAKRTDAALVKRLDRAPPVPLYALVHDGKRVQRASSLVAEVDITKAGASPAER